MFGCSQSVSHLLLAADDEPVDEELLGPPLARRILPPHSSHIARLALRRDEDDDYEGN